MSEHTSGSPCSSSCSCRASPPPRWQISPDHESCEVPDPGHSAFCQRRLGSGLQMASEWLRSPSPGILVALNQTQRNSENLKPFVGKVRGSLCRGRRRSVQLPSGGRVFTRRAGFASRSRRSTFPKLPDHLLLGLHQLQQHRLATISLSFGIRDFGKVLGFGFRVRLGLGFRVLGAGMDSGFRGSDVASVPRIWGLWRVPMCLGPAANLSARGELKGLLLVYSAFWDLVLAQQTNLGVLVWAGHFLWCRCSFLHGFLRRPSLALEPLLRDRVPYMNKRAHCILQTHSGVCNAV